MHGYSQIGAMLTLVLVVIVGIYGLLRLRAASRAAAEREKQKALKEKERREMAQKDLQKRLDRAKNPDVLEQAKAAVQQDPKRAAKVISKMLREKK